MGLPVGVFTTSHEQPAGGQGPSASRRPACMGRGTPRLGAPCLWSGLRATPPHVTRAHPSPSHQADLEMQQRRADPQLGPRPQSWAIKNPRTQACHVL